MDERDDKLSIAAIAVAAMCIATAAHEAVGHGLTCALHSGAITQLTSAYFQCSVGSGWIAAGGPAGNLVAWGLATLLLMATPRRAPHARLLFFLIAAFSAFWFAGQPLYSAALNEGDFFYFARDLFGAPSMPLRIAAALAAIAFYAFAIHGVRRYTAGLPDGRARTVLRVSWLAASIAAVAAALLYAPDRLGAAGQAALEIGAASLPLLTRNAIAPPGARVEPAITRSVVWIGAGLVVFAIFAATLGRGLP